ncbi:hypothetical protein VC_A0326 [Vibrio cholerae O1 biovar El Tor str. N16961]|uniref:Uncharacterized protein n=2 Tax=Vibrio cholerae TaxID=666 RepID=Q9KML1_VIBCH|nr:hypothetical protein VC_A0326 [Vibrio cholerae O1 biovar El Tor str. N16961]ACP07344.1 hypothetical protein VCM66_A0374 [Vibrio cholerae M66-2]
MRRLLCLSFNTLHLNQINDNQLKSLTKLRIILN